MVHLGIDFVTSNSDLFEATHLPHKNTRTTIHLYFVWYTYLRGP